MVLVLLWTFLPLCLDFTLMVWFSLLSLWVFSPHLSFCLHQDRVPFVVPDRVPWSMMFNTLNSKFTSEVQTHHNLDYYNQHFLAQKIFDKTNLSEDYTNMQVSWAQFNKVHISSCTDLHRFKMQISQICLLTLQEVLPGRPFTFWQWFEGVMELTKKHLKDYWSEGSDDHTAVSRVNVCSLWRPVVMTSVYDVLLHQADIWVHWKAASTPDSQRQTWWDVLASLQWFRDRRHHHCLCVFFWK